MLSFVRIIANYFDKPDFRPYVTSVLVPDGTEIKGAMLLCAGGAFAFRGNYGDTRRLQEH